MQANHRRLKKELGLLNVWAIATGTTLSAGFFLLPGLAVMQAGAAVPLAYLIAAVPLIPSMLCIVELSTAMPRAGGAYYFLARSMGPLVGTIGGLGTWLALALKTAFALVGLGAYVNLVFHVPVLPLAVVLAVAFGGVNLIGAKSVGSAQVVLVTGLLAILGWFVVDGMMAVEMVHFSGFLDSGWNSILSTAGLVYISYVGVTKVASVSEEIKDPEKNLPRGIFLALVVTVSIYAIGTFVMVGVAGVDALHGDYTPVATTAEIFLGSWGVKLVTVAAICAFASVANAGILSASRYPLAMSRDSVLPPVFRHMSRREIPVAGVVLTVGLVVVIVLAFDPMKIAKLASAFQLLVFAMLCLAVVVMRESGIESYDPGYRAPFYPWTQVVGIAASLALIGQMGWMPILFAVGLVVFGAWWHLHYAHTRVARVAALYYVFERLGKRRHEGLDYELRGILKEKGLREEDPFDEIVARAFVIDLTSSTEFADVASQAADRLAERVPAAAGHILEGFMRGTKVGATPVAKGAALPHLRLPELANAELVIVRATDGVQIATVDEFGEAIDVDQEIRAVFFFVSPEANPGQHLRILAQLAGRIDSEDFLPSWQASEGEQDLKETILRTERYRSLSLVPGTPAAALIGQRLADVEFPGACLAATVHRGDWTFVPRASTVFREGDRVTVIGEPDGIKAVKKSYG